MIKTNRGLWALTSFVLTFATVSLLFGLSTYTTNPATDVGVGMTGAMAVLAGLRALFAPSKKKA